MLFVDKVYQISNYTSPSEQIETIEISGFKITCINNKIIYAKHAVRNTTGIYDVTLIDDNVIEVFKNNIITSETIKLVCVVEKTDNPFFCKKADSNRITLTTWYCLNVNDHYIINERYNNNNNFKIVYQHIKPL